MKIDRHQTNIAHIGDVCREAIAYVDRAFATISRTPNNLYPLYLTAVRIVNGGSVVEPNSVEVARSLKLGSRAAAAVFAFATEISRPESFVLEGGVSVSYSRITDESYINILLWQKAFYFVTIARQPDAFAFLNDIPYQLLMRSSTRSHGQSDLGYRIIDVYKALWTNPGEITSHSVFVEFEQFCRSGPNNSAPNKYVERMTAPQLRVMRHLASGDADGFTEALTDALKLHKKHWSSTEQLRKDFDGFVSLPLTAIAALAWDRGMRFQVESDYLPWSWVTGEIFR